jgi:hypothetical protein
VVLADTYGTFLYEASAPDFDFSPALQGNVQGGALVVYDQVAQALLIVGGSPTNGAPILGEVQRWDGTTLVDLPLTDPDADGNPDTSDTLVTPGIGFDPVLQRTLVVAPNTPQGVTDIWQLDLGNDRPGLTCAFRVAAAQAPVGATFTQLHLEATAQSTGADGGPVGTQLELWSSGAWRAVQSCSSCTGLSATVSDPGAIARALEDLDTLGVGLTPLATNAGGLAQVSVAAVQATLTYRLP